MSSEKAKPKHVKLVLEKLRKTENELGEYCIEQVAENLRRNGYKDSKLWATTIISSMLGDIETFEGAGYLEALIYELEGPEKNAAEALYEIISEFEEALIDINPEHVKDALTYSIGKTIDRMDKKKYRRIYG